MLELRCECGQSPGAPNHLPEVCRSDPGINKLRISDRGLQPLTLPLSPVRLCHNRKRREEAVGFQSFRKRVFWIMGNRRLHKIERFHTLGTSESEALKVTALNLFHPTTSSPFSKNRFFHIVTQPQWERDGVRGG
jgi:hypothetical protein